MVTIKESHLVKTRKEHNCHWCFRKILKWETASSFTWKEDYIYTIYTCKECEEFINLAENIENVKETYRNWEATKWRVLEFHCYKEWLSN